MKRLIFLAVSAMLLTVLVNAQTTEWIRNFGDYKVWQIGPDTTFGADTLTYNFPAELTGNWQYNIQYVNDSIGGGTAGTLKLYVSNDPDASVSYVKETVTLNGATRQNALWTGTFSYPDMYIEKITSGTDTSIFRAWFVIKKDK